MRILVLWLFFGASLWAQQQAVPVDINKNQNFQKFTALKKAGNNLEAFKLGYELLDAYYTHTDLYFDLGLARAALPNAPQEGAAMVQKAYDLEPIYDRLAQAAISYAFYTKDLARAKQLLWEYSFYPRPPEDFTAAMNYLKGSLEYYKSSFTADQANTAQQLLNMHRSEATQNMKYFWEHFNPVYSASPEEMVQKGPAHYLNLLAPVKKQMQAGAFPVSYYNQSLETLATRTFWNNWKQAAILIPELKEQFSNARTTPMMKLKIYDILSKINEVNRNYEDNLSLATIMLDELPKYSYSNSAIMLAANNYLFSLIQREQFKEAYAFAKQVESLFEKVTQPEVKMNGYYNLSRAYSYGGDKAKGIQLAEAGVAYMKNTGNESHPQFGKTLPENLQALNVFQDKSTLVETDLNSNDVIELYDYGQQLGMQKKYAEAVPFYEKAFQLYKPKVKAATGSERSNLLDLYTKIGGNLIACLFESKQTDKIFPFMEELKANGLLTSKSGATPVSLPALQKSLKPDEALIYYSDVMRGNTHEGVYMAAVITNNTINYRYVNAAGALMRVYVDRNADIGEIEKKMAQRELRQPHYTVYRNLEEAGYNQYKKGDFVLLAELYRSFLNPSEGGEVQQQFTDSAYRDYIAGAFYTDLVSRLEPWFEGKKRLYISADGILNFLPFESFKNPLNRYLVEDYEIGYVPSGSLLADLRQRTASAYEKNVLAFGDAKYEKYASVGRELKSGADIKRLELDVEKSLQLKEPLDYAFATFSKEAMKYLKGAKAEVLAINELVPKTDLFLDTQMTENHFKKLHAAGALHKYKTIHLSSHASVHPYVFDLSGIAFSVYANPREGEDGILTVAEMGALDIETDFMFLSACQTGLGKLVPGEGVQGLNQAMLMAGANSTLTTLWSVNDYGTKIYTTQLYNKIFNENKEYLTASTEVKRAFIRGDYSKQLDLSHPQFWAPFIYTGK
ncbi:CHAT domain-containing protein [Leeuwenhoekiella sp. H156]|uniref:CHAT domain-containing protein n=1 Tax=Leeuwenhoekiella sp. H156 TaxID=3450128 RepID=UPI003FA49357